MENINWIVRDQPIIKIADKGKYALTDAEVLSLIIGGKDSLQKSYMVLEAVDGKLSLLSEMSVVELSKIDGIGRHKASAIVSAFEINRRRQSNEANQMQKITSSRHAFDIFYPLIGDLKHEEFWIVTMNRANKMIKTHKISSGGISGTIADPKIIFKHALDDKCSSLIMCHNHPSGNLQPSEADVKLTKKMSDAGKLLDIMVLDSLIISSESFYSFADEGRLQ